MKTLSHTGIYTLGTILRNAVSIVMLPIYTRYLTPEDYGVLELLSMVTDFVGIILCNRIGDAIFRYYSEAENVKDKNTVISTSYFLAASLNTLGFIIIFLLSDQIAFYIIGDIETSRLLILFAITFILEAVIIIPLIYIRAEQMPWLFLAASILKLTLQVSLNVYFVIILDMRVEGVIYSAIISSTIMGIILSFYLFYRINMNISYTIVRNIIVFSLPLVVSTLGSFYLTFGDRYFLRIYNDLTEVGIYTLGYKFGFILTMIAWEPFSRVWDIEKYNIYKLSNATEEYQKTFLFYNLYLIVIALAIALFVEDLLRIMSDYQFWPAHEIVPIILVAYTVWVWTKFCDLGILIKKNTKQFAYAELLAVVVITVGYTALIPLYGRMGAAYATLFGFIARFFWVYISAKKSYDMKLPWLKISYIVIAAFFIYSLSVLSPENIIPSIIYRGVLLILFLGIIISLPLYTKLEKKEFLKQTISVISSMRKNEK
jgi:O-antigen/teichoic acid export membrane protein